MRSCSSDSNAESSTQLLERFRSGFRFRLATSDEEKRKVYRLRYEVYCDELGYEEPSDACEGLEYDEYDERSLHFLIEHRRSGRTAGCLRLVLPSSEDDCHDTRLPLQSYADQSLTHAVLHPALLDKDEICEVSRLAIALPFRRRSVKAELEASVKSTFLEFTQDEKKTFPVIVVGLFLATYALVGMTNRRHVFAMMEPKLPRLLAMSGFYFTQVGDTIDFHGKRSAFYIDQHQAEREIHAKLLPLYRHIQDELESQANLSYRQKTLAMMP
ncbi:PEP-CTERM/exosortase system-associated acyltransferase [Halomonas rhizosphaerae]|uniref:PEP-CTERM/exosortase system-associated acyltransferase n=1 Tax=Halomonas rhizosphaerae TaxID=3043296 RepID=A0ABT6V2S0_9GAMM|nr:PEP-CTERM/exosortase system-associated acyltransferase [Halomonas rhizosphaerae]MDI5892531.1 PEP-CTERM/exosortase system-associated acyltransferase [Halomonas rhizosphaerae]